MSTFRNLRDPHPLNDGSNGYLVTLEIDVGEGWEETLYVARPSGGGLSDEVLAEIAAGNFTGEITDYVPPAAAPLTDRPLTQAQWHYGLRRFGLLAEVEAFVATLETTDTIAAYQFEARSLRSNTFLYADVLALLAAYAGVLPAPLQLSAGDVAAMWSTVLSEMPT